MDWFEIWRLKRGRKRCVGAFAKELKQAKDWADRQQIDQNEHWELSEYDDRIALLKTQKLLKKARARDLVIPFGDDFWERSDWFHEKFLTTSGRAKLREDIRNDGKQRRDVIRDISIAISTLIAILSLINSCRRK